jgi:phosphoribosylformylglycinamidine cyclo-ligase
MLPVFPFLQKKGNVEEDEMYRVFNMGIGMVVVVSPEYTDQIMDELKSTGETVYKIGKIIEGEKKVLFS